MYGGIGLSTPKGSATNGYVQKNVATVTGNRVDFQKLNKSWKALSDLKMTIPNKELLMHKEKRRVELDLLKLEDELREAGMKDDEIESKILLERTNMLAAVEEGALRYEAEEKEAKDTHQLALEKEQEIAKLGHALHVDGSSHKHGQAFDQQLQAQKRLERVQARAETEQKRLLASSEAESAQNKAVKLRAKAEKARKKAEVKLAKLEAKQNKRKVKKEGKVEAKESKRKMKKEQGNDDVDDDVKATEDPYQDGSDDDGSKAKKAKTKKEDPELTAEVQPKKEKNSGESSGSSSDSSGSSSSSSSISS